MIYDAEHFFDGYRDDSGYALECLRAAAEAGAENVTLCDTNGSSLPAQVAEATGAMSSSSSTVAVGIHTHNDPECAVANSLAAVEQGASLVQGTMNGIGERTGNANLDLDPARAAAQAGLRVREPDEQLAPADRDRALHRRALNITPDPDQPFVGRNAFAHKGGMHVAGVKADARTFEHMDPDAGRQRARAAGLRALRQGDGAGARRAGRHPARRRAGGARGRTLKEREHRGYHYEAADASFELLLRREAGATSRCSGSRASAS